MKYALYIFLFSFFGFVTGCMAQTGLTVGPPRIFFVANGGQYQTQYVDVTNPSKDYTLELGVSFEDWSYSIQGDNVMSPKGSLATSCANWVTVSEHFFSLRPMETKRLLITLTVPEDRVYSDSLPVHTVMLFVTQLNPRVGEEREGANIRLAVRSGVKIYHRFNEKEYTDLEITDFKYTGTVDDSDYLELDYVVNSNVWVQGRLRVEFINQETGKKSIIDNIDFYCLPHDTRKQLVSIPNTMERGNYVASAMFFYGEQEVIKVAELTFDYAPTN